MLALLLFQGLLVLTTGTLLLVGLAAWMTDQSTYSFGHDSVLLASLVRRCLARLFDLSLIFGPLCIQTVALLSSSNSELLTELITLDAARWFLFLPSIVWMCLAWGILVTSTGIGGITPGKWLFGIRVVRSTLRPCGIFHALLRELLFWADVPQLASAIPGVLCMLATEKRQRIGDLVAGTLVIDMNRRHR